MTKEVKKLDPNWKDRIEKVGKNTFQRQEMLRLGFWEPKEIPADEVASLRNKLNKTVNSLSEKKTKLGEVHKKIKETQNVKKLIAEIKKRRIQKSLREREIRKTETQERKQENTIKDRERRKVTPPYLGEGVSGRLTFSKGEQDKLKELDLPLLNNLTDLSELLLIDEGKIAWLAYHRVAANSDHYHRFLIPKRSGAPRLITSPKPVLREAQGWINREILSKLEPELEAKAFKRKTNIKDNAQIHCGKGLVIRVDLSDFFFSITFPRVRGFFISLGYNPGVSTVLALLCTESDRTKVTYKKEDWFIAQGERRLPQGACTSPALSNLIARRLDRRIRKYLASIDEGWSYTRYADDLAVSHPESDAEVKKVLKALQKIVPDEGFSINEKKTAIMRRPHRQIITGLILNDQEPRIPRVYLKKVRAMVHRADQLYKSGVVPENLYEIKGKLSFIKMIMPEHVEKIVKKYSWLDSNESLIKQ